MVMESMKMIKIDNKKINSSFNVLISMQNSFKKYSLHKISYKLLKKTLKWNHEIGKFNEKHN